jgi:hypothetical protein
MPEALCAIAAKSIIVNLKAVGGGNSSLRHTTPHIKNCLRLYSIGQVGE